MQSFFNSLFGQSPAETSKKVRKSTSANTNESIQQLRKVIEKFDKRETHLMKQVDQLQAQAKARIAKKDKKGAMNFLKKKKMYEKQLGTICQKRMNVETQIMTLEESTLNAQTMAAMAQGVKAMKNEIQQTDVDNIDDLMMDMQEAQDDMTQINEALCGDMNNWDDDDDLLAELNMMEELEVDQQFADLPQVNTSSNQQNIQPGEIQPGQTNPPSVLTQEQQDEQELQTMMMMA